MAHATKFALLGLTLMLAACRSDPIHYHTLIPQQPVPVNSVDVQLELISVPPQVDRPQLVIRQSNSSLAILETEWWAASLVDELSSALQDQLVNGNSQRKMSVRLDVQRFDSIPGQYGLIDVKWRLRKLGGGDNALVTCRSTLQTPSGPSIDDLVAAQQNNVKRLAALITQAANGTQRGCPSAQ